MDKTERIIDLKREERFVEEYVSLRNRYSELLTTKPVTVAETRDWLKDDQIEIRALVEGDVFLGAVILYLSRDGEIAVFVRDRCKGMGTKLLKIIEQVAKEKKIESVWAWVLNDNFLAQRIFEKNGFVKEGMLKRMYEEVMNEGIRYKKDISS